MEKIIEPDYSIGSFSFYNADNIDIMKCYPDNYFELAIVDPPYGINAPKMSATPCQRKSGSKRLNSGSGKLKDRNSNKSIANGIMPYLLMIILRN